MTTPPDPQGVTAAARASDPRHSAWVDASAGTGKTSVLTRRVLRLLLSGAAPDRILCITFTRAAAAEMSNRLIARLGDWTVMEDGALQLALFDLTGERPAPETQTRARQLFARIVESPAGFRIQTIHAFCQSVLRRFPLEAGIAPHFDLLEDRTAAELLAEAQQSVLMEAGRAQDAPLGRALAELTPYMDERGFGALIRTVVAQRRALEACFAAQGGVGLLIPRMWRGLGLEPGQTADDILAQACHDDAIDCAGLRRACAGLAQGSATDARRAAAILAFLDHPDRPALWDSYLAAFLTKAGEPNKAFARTKAHQSLADRLEPEADRLVAVIDRLRAGRTAAATEAMLRIASAIFDRYARAKAARALLDYDDLIDITRRLVESAAAWVLYKLDGGIDHLLLDEAQDTNPEQWAIVQALAAEFFAGEGAQAANRTIFVVGDGKQSIYSFQGAEPRALAGMRAHFDGRLRAIDRELKGVEITKSYRSTRPVLNLVDAVFTDPAAADGLFIDPLNPMRHDIDRIAAPGLVELWPVIAQPDAGESAEPWAVPAAARYAADPVIQLAERLSQTIAMWVRQGVAPGDIMILVRRRTRFVGPMVRALKAAGVPVAGIDRMALTEPLAVRDLIALGRFLLLPEDDLNLAAMLKSPLIGLSEDDLFRLAHQRQGALWNALLASAEIDRDSFEPARVWLAGLLAEADYVRPFEMLAGVLARPCPGDPGAGGSGRRALWRRLGPDALDPLDELLSAALDYERRHAPTLEGFVGWLEIGEAEIKRELAGQGRAVRIVTVHGAKGLEAKIVVLPDTTQLPAPPTGPLLLWRDDGRRSRIPYWSPRAEFRPAACEAARLADRMLVEQEYRRLLYVALTRARDRLYVCGWRGSRASPPGNWHGLIEAGMRRLGAESIPDISGGERLRLAWLGDGLEPVAAAPAAQSPEVPPPDWARLPAPAERRPFRPLAPSRIEFPGMVEPPVRSPATAENAGRFRRGRAMHTLLQRLPDIDPARRARAALRLLPGFDADERAEMVAQALAVIEDPACARFFGPGSLAEAPIVGRIGQRGVAGQIDRLLVEPTAVTIVDFKSGRIPEGGADHVPSAYLAQMAAYRAVLRQIYPARAIHLVLIWTDGPMAVPLDPAALDPFERYLTSVIADPPSPT